jgi:DNA-binding CsgD family transcriptional regulator
MPRKRNQVTEDSSRLKQIEAGVAGTKPEIAIRMLRLLEEDPDRTLGEVASLMNCSERTVHRWWKLYIDGGIDALLTVTPAGGKRPTRLPAHALQAFRTRAQQGFSELKEAQQWLVQEYGVSYSLARISEILKKERSGTPQSSAVQNQPVPAESSTPTDALPPEAAILRFINKMPLTSDITEWILAFRDALCELLDGVDRVSVGINTFFLVGPPTLAIDRIGTRLIREIPVDNAEQSPWAVMEYDSSGPPCQQLVQVYSQRYKTEARYHPPYPIEYFSEDRRYIGSIVLWANREGSPIPEHTVDLILQLRPFITFALTDAVARHECNNPVHHPFREALINMSAEAGLTGQESRIILLRLLGKSYKSIAEIVHISIGTVKKHFSSIHRKTGTGCQAELFAKYFTGHSILHRGDNLSELA